MSTTITVRDIDPEDKSWLKREAHSAGISMSEFVRRLIREKRKQSEQISQPSAVFRKYFGPENGIDLPLNERFGYRPVFSPNETNEWLRQSIEWLTQYCRRNDAGKATQVLCRPKFTRGRSVFVWLVVPQKNRLMRPFASSALSRINVAMAHPSLVLTQCRT